MRRTATIASTVALLLTALLLTATSSPGKKATGGNSARTYVTGLFATPGQIRGTVVATRAKAVISLHGLTANGSYEVVASSEPCSVIDAADYVIWKTEVQTGPGDDVFKAAAVDNTPQDGPQRIKGILILRSDGPTSVCTKPTVLRQVR
jgi:hypothetical protein